MESFEHPCKTVAEALREIIITTYTEIGEEIKWNAPAFFYTGEMQAFNPKEYKRHFIVFNFQKKDGIRMVFLDAAKLNDTSGLLEGDYADGRRLAMFHTLEEVKSNKKILQTLIQNWLKLINK